MVGSAKTLKNKLLYFIAPIISIALIIFLALCFFFNMPAPDWVKIFAIYVFMLCAAISINQQSDSCLGYIISLSISVLIMISYFSVTGTAWNESLELYIFITSIMIIFAGVNLFFGIKYFQKSLILLICAISVIYFLVTFSVEFYWVFMDANEVAWRERAFTAVKEFMLGYLFSVILAFVIGSISDRRNSISNKNNDENRCILVDHKVQNKDQEAIERACENQGQGQAKSGNLFLNNENSTIEIYKGSYAVSIKLFDILQVIIGKVCSSFLILNGGAAVAVLAFIGHIMGLEPNVRILYLSGVLHSLLSFAVGSLFAVGVVTFSYFSQSKFCEDAENQRVMIAAWLGQGGKTLEGKMIFPYGLPKENQKLARLGIWLKYGVILNAGISAMCFLTGVIVFYCTFT